MCKPQQVALHFSKGQEEVEDAVEQTEAPAGAQGFVDRMTNVDRGGIEGTKAGANDGAQAIHKHGFSHGVVITCATLGNISNWFGDMNNDKSQVNDSGPFYWFLAIFRFTFRTSIHLQQTTSVKCNRCQV